MTGCPVAFFCVNNTDIYTKCDEHYYCEANSTEQTPCPAGTIGWGNPNNMDAATGCTDCDPGTYSTAIIIGECPI